MIIMHALPKSLSVTASWSPKSAFTLSPSSSANLTQAANESSQSVPCCKIKSKLVRNKRSSCPPRTAVNKLDPKPGSGLGLVMGSEPAISVERSPSNSPPEEQRVQQHSGCKASVRSSTPSTTIESMPKARNRNQTTTAIIAKPAMHRKSKCKSKNKPFGELMTETVTFLPLPSSVKASQSSTDTVLSTITNHNNSSDSATGRTVPTVLQLGTTITKRRRRGRSTKTPVSTSSGRCRMFIPIPTLGTTSFVTLLTLICIETVLLSTMSSCAKTFYMHWNTSNSIFRIDNTDHIIDVNKGNLAFEFDQVHIICPVYEPGTFENETEKYIIYNVSKVEYETCRITNADPRVIAICDKPQKLMFFTITFRPFTPQPGGLEFLPGNDYYFISTSSKDDLYRRIGGRCSTNNMKVVFKVCCAAEEKNKTIPSTTTSVAVAGSDGGVGGGGSGNVINNAATNDDHNPKHAHGHHNIGGNTIGISGVNTGLISGGSGGNGAGGAGMAINVNNGLGMGMGTSINTNIDQFNRIPIQPNIMGNNIGSSGVGPGPGLGVGGGIILSPGHGHGSINMLPPGRGGVNVAYPGHHHTQTGIRINNVPTQQNYPPHKGNGGNSNANGNDDQHHYDKHPNEVVKNEELTYNRGSSRTSGHCVSQSATALLIILVTMAIQRLIIIHPAINIRPMHRPFTMSPPPLLPSPAGINASR
ncbi:uncharacterized protein Ephrin [Drosophila tropicalis]|uniref:uncharacterized protein Ephrin n=1 Tax=Drosophila tropicalis TaxID=46794 RepID=UPI0035AB8CAA